MRIVGARPPLDLSTADSATADRLDTEAGVLALVRDLRRALGHRCPRCGGRDVARWGTFSGRQRYRCGLCARTFSDLTGTPLSYTKRLHAWPDHLTLMRHRITLRDESKRLGVHLATAFRWRHATLRAIDQRPGDGLLEGVVEILDVAFARSWKGCRSDESKVRGGLGTPEWHRRGYDRVLIMRSRGGDTRARVLPRDRPLRDAIGDALDDSVAHRAIVVCSGRAHDGVVEALCRSPRHCVLPETSRGTSQRVRRRRFELTSRALAVAGPITTRAVAATSYAWRLYDWMLFFRGVASRYLSHYLTWHQLLDDRREREWMRWCVGGAMRSGLDPPV